MKATLFKFALLLLAAATLHAAPFPMGTAFTYQGRLNDGGVPANGSYHFRMTLYADSVLPLPVGPDVTVLDVPVVNGLFTLKLDFGVNVFRGDARWLGLEVRTNSNVSTFSELAPRQELTPEPYAIYAGLAAAVTNEAITTPMIAPGAVSAPQLGTSGAPASGQVLTFDGSGLAWTTPPGSAPAWLLGGNGSTTPGTDFLGTTDDRALEVKVNGQRALRIDPAGGLPNLTGGSLGNYIDAAGVRASVIGGGDTNRINSGAWWSTIGGGAGNQAYGLFNTIGGGVQNQVLGGNSVVAGGSSNLIYGSHDFLGGGIRNSISTNRYAVLVGGDRNQSWGDWSFIGGGESNTTYGFHAVLNGGKLNFANAHYSVVGGGYGNLASGQSSTLGGGQFNAAANTNATVSGGNNNHADGPASAVAGGENNSAPGEHSAIGGGLHSRASGQFSTVAGGTENAATNYYASVGGGGLNSAHGISSTVAGGYDNAAKGQDSTVGGGSYNTSFAHYSVIAGGTENYIGTNLLDLIEFGVQTNTAYISSIAGGAGNRNIGVYSAIGGGLDNIIIGQGNNIEANYAVIGGGQNNRVTAGNGGTVGGGINNTAFGDYSTIPGGRSAVANHYGQWAYASGHLDTKGDAQISTYVLSRKFNGNGDLYLNGDTSDGHIFVPVGAVWALHFHVSAVGVTSTNHAAYEVSGIIANFAGVRNFRLMDGSGAVVTEARPIYETPGAVGWVATPNQAVDGSLHVTVSAGETVKWCARIDVTEVSR